MLWRSYRKRAALESYRTVLGRRLRGMYGRRDAFDADAVLAAITDCQLSRSYACYALAMYCDRSAFDAHHASTGSVACSYDRIRHELSVCDELAACDEQPFTD